MDERKEFLKKFGQNIVFPVRNFRQSKNYLLMFEDANNITHYIDWNGRYDGWSREVSKKSEAYGN